MRKLLALAATVGLALSTCSTTSPQVATANGVVEGICVRDSPVQVHGFLGIPFAEPPVRFAKPVSKSNWTGVLNTKTHANVCTQVTSLPQSEDCLYLNVFKPATGTGRSVFVVVHGGAFATGGAQQGTPDDIAKNLASRGLVVVLVQFRLGPLGFCTTKDSVLPGNYGMWDAKMAFEWIRDNIAAFGGNPNDVTAYGGSSGAAMIDGMHLSPLTTNLFHKMALFSGAARDMWDAPTKQTCEDRATSLGLTWTDSASFKAALMGADANADAMKGGWLVVGEKQFNSMLCDFAPSLDGDFFPTSPAAMRAATQPKPAIFGISFLEGAGMSGALTIDSHTVEKIVDYMVPVGVPNRTQFQSYLLEQYRNQATILEPTAIDKHAAMAAFGERTFASTMDAVLRRNFELFGTNQTTYRYVFKHFSQAMMGPMYPFISYATHSFDQTYALGMAGFTFTGDDQIVADLYSNALVNFAKTGNPNGSGASALPVEWKVATPSNPSLNYVIETTPYMDAQFFHGRPNLNNILNKIGGTFKPV